MKKVDSKKTTKSFKKDNKKSLSNDVVDVVDVEETSEKGSCGCCFNFFGKKMPCELKLCYILTILSLILGVFNIVVSNKNITNWINKNPRVILDSVNKWAQEEQEKAIREQQKQAAENIGKYSEELRSSTNAGVVNPKGTKEIVEFFDYNCGYCKIAYRTVEEVVKSDKDVKVILRPIPILGEASKYATEVGVAILKMEPKNYVKYYKAIMDGSARNKSGVEKAVDSADMKLSKVEKYIEEHKDEIEKSIQYNLELANKIGINGTPAFIVNGELIPGAIDKETLEGKLK